MAKRECITIIDLLAGAVSLAATSAPCVAGEMPFEALQGMGYKQAKAADFVGTPHFHDRAENPTAWLAVTADFNGDGKDDEARLLLNPNRKIAYVVVTILTTKLDTYVLKIIPLADVEDIGIRLGPRVAATDAQPARASLTIFRLDGGADTYTFNGEEFDHHPDMPSASH